MPSVEFTLRGDGASAEARAEVRAGRGGGGRASGKRRAGPTPAVERVETIPKGGWAVAGGKKRGGGAPASVASMPAGGGDGAAPSKRAKSDTEAESEADCEAAARSAMRRWNVSGKGPVGFAAHELSQTLGESIPLIVNDLSAEQATERYATLNHVKDSTVNQKALTGEEKRDGVATAFDAVLEKLQGGAYAGPKEAGWAKTQLWEACQVGWARLPALGG